jgi:hypothetical protein
LQRRIWKTRNACATIPTFSAKRSTNSTATAKSKRSNRGFRKWSSFMASRSSA